MRTLNLAGQVFNRLTVLTRGEDHLTPSGHRFAKWLCRCSCGEQRTVLANALRSGVTQSCGCLRREHASARAPQMGRANRRKIITYKSAHDRVRRERGKAKMFACVDCSSPAVDWTYNHADPDELIGEVRLPSGKTKAVRFSVNPEHYSPRCRSCHMKFDLYTAMVTMSG